MKLVFLVLTLFFFFLSEGSTNHHTCPRSSHFWAKHNALDTKEPWPFILREIKHEFTETRRIMNGTITWYQILQKKKRNVCENAAVQWITHKLNDALTIMRIKSIDLGDTKEKDGNSIELENIIENHCTNLQETSTLNNILMKRLHELSVYFTTINSDYNQDQCVLYKDLDCNENMIRDQCEIDFEKYSFMCDRGNFNSPSFINCKIDASLSNSEACLVYKKYKKGSNLDCNSNRLLDKCETRSKSDVSCLFRHCWFVPDGERITKECSECRSLDENLDGIPDTCQSEYKPPEMKDCNQNFIEDHIDLITGVSQDTNNNNIPDECEIGFYCGEECIDGSLRNFTQLKDFEHKNFYPGEICRK